MKLVHKIILGFLLVAVIGWGTEYFAVRTNKQILQEYFQENVGNLLLQTLDRIDEYIFSKIDVFQQYFNNPSLQKAVIRSNQDFEKTGDIRQYIDIKDKAWVSGESGGIEAFKHDLQNNSLAKELREKTRFYEERYGSKVFREVFITNRYGANVAQTGITANYRQDNEAWWIKAKREGLSVQDIVYDESSGDYSLTAGIRINDDYGRFIGVMKVVLNADMIIDIVKNMKVGNIHGRHKSMEIKLLNQEGRVIFSTVKGEGFNYDLSGALDYHDMRTASGKTASKTENGRLTVYAHSRGHMDLNGLAWALIVEHSEGEIFDPVAEMKNKMLAGSLFVTGIALLIGLLTTLSVSKRFRELIKATEEVGHGNLDTAINTAKGDEIGELSRAFKAMTDKLKTTTVKTEELTREVAERKKAEDMLLQSRFDWADTFNNISDMVTLHDKDFNIIRANTAAKEHLNLPFLENIQSKCFSYYHGMEKPLDGCPSCECHKTGELSTVEIFEPHLKKHIEIRAMPRFDNNNELVGFVHIVRDISNRKRTEGLIQRQLKRINALHAIDLAITSSFDLRVTLDIFLEQVTTQLEVDSAAVLLLNKSTQVLEYVASKGFRSSALKHTKLRIGESNAGLAALKREIVIIKNLKTERDGFARSTHINDEGFVTYFAVPLIAKGEIKGVLEIFNRSPLEVEKDWTEFFVTMATQAAIAIDDSMLFENLQRSNVELSLAYDTTIEGWSRAMDLRDSSTEGHSQRVAKITVHIARKLGVKEEDIIHVRRGALLHDMGKMGIPDSILLKPGKLDEKEWEIMKRHTTLAHDMLYPIEYLRPALDIPYYHHERLDGTGYPKGLKGKEIPLAARIFAVVDIWDALISERPYRPAWPKDKVREYTLSITGTHLDHEVVEVFLEMDL